MAIAFVQTTNGSGNNTTSVATSNFGSSVTVNNYIIVAVTVDIGANNVTSVTDTLGNSYSKAVGQANGNNNNATDIWYGLVTTGGTNAVTAHYNSGSQPASIVAQEFSGLASSSVLDKTHGNNGTGTPLDSQATTTTSQASELLFGAGGTRGGAVTYSLGSGYSNLDSNTTQTSATCGAESQVVSATGTYNATFGISASLQWQCVIATFKGGAGAAAASAPEMSLLGVGL